MLATSTGSDRVVRPELLGPHEGGGLGLLLGAEAELRTVTQTPRVQVAAAGDGEVVAGSCGERGRWG